MKDQQRVIVLGTAQAGITLVRELLKRPELNLKVVGFLDEKGENIGKSLVNPSIIGSVHQVSGWPSAGAVSAASCPSTNGGVAHPSNNFFN